MSTNAKGEVIWKCSVRGCKNKDNLTLDPRKITGLLQPDKITILCDEHKIFYRDEYKGYVMTLEALGCGCCAMNKLYEPNNKKPVRKGQVDISLTGNMLTRNWTSGIDVLITQQSLR